MGADEVKTAYRFRNRTEGKQHEIDIEVWIENVGTEDDPNWQIVPAYASLLCGLTRVFWIPDGPSTPVIDELTLDKSCLEIPNLNVIEPPHPYEDTRNWTAVFEKVQEKKPPASGSEPKAPDMIPVIRYTFSGKERNGRNGGSFGPSDFTHDPTIAVTNDPPPGCGWPLGTERGAGEAGLPAQRVEEG